MPEVLPGEVYRHFKGGRYLVFAQARSAVDLYWVVVYVSLATGEYWTRPVPEWAQEVTWPDDILRARFVADARIAHALPTLLPLWAAAPKRV